MRLSALSFFMILTTIFLSGCGKSQMASLTDRGNNFYARTGVVPLNGGGSGGFAYSTETVAPTETAAISVASNDLPPPSAASTSAAPRAIASRWQWPVQGSVIQRFGGSANGTASEGIVIAAAEGAPIHAAQPGEVAYVGHDVKNFGNIVILRHADGSMSSYSHAKEISVTKGQRVVAGSVIGTVGKSGNAREPQLHFAVREKGMTVDPLNKLPQQVASK